ENLSEKLQLGESGCPREWLDSLASEDERIKLPNFILKPRAVERTESRERERIEGARRDFVDLGMVTSIEYNHKSVESARKGQEVCIKIEPVPGEAPKMFGRHFEAKDFLVSKISRQSIDACKDYFRDDLLKTDWQLMVELKKLFQIL
ncbi:Eukaryotic translation initiation factor 5B, partial [Trachymyrmex septentrionalis]